MNNPAAATGRPLLPLLIAILCTGCGTDPELERDRARDEAYVQVMTDLMLLDASPPAGSTNEEREARADSARREVLARHGVTAEEVLEFAREVGGEAGRMESLWKQITDKYDSTRVANLRRDTEARSESEGKLGESARAGGSGDSTAAGTGVGDDLPRPPGRYSGGGAEALQRARQRLQQPANAGAAAPDTTPPND